MSSIKREIFRRGVRMTHPFEELQRNADPLGGNTFEWNTPIRVDQLSQPGRPCEIQEYGERMYREPSSGVSKPNSDTLASINGPQPDYAEIFARPIPVGTKRRLGPLKTDK